MVKVTDFSNMDMNENLPWDLVEDLMVFMRNDPAFYRRHMYPMMLNVQEAVKNGGKFSKKEMIPIVDAAVKKYVKKFNIKKRPEDLLADNDKIEIINRILEAEVENFKKGEY
jgi:hypothetical protein